MIRYARLIAVWTLLAATPIMEARFAAAQEPGGSYTTPDWGDYPMLMSQFGELCTMCEAYVKCTPDTARGAEQQGFNLYYFQVKSFWGQIATIWIYFAVWFDPITSEERPAAIYRFDGSRAVIPTTAYLSEEDALIEIDDTQIDRDSADWHNSDGVRIGTCTRLGIPESMAMISRSGQWMEQQQADAGQ